MSEDPRPSQVFFRLLGLFCLLCAHGCMETDSRDTSITRVHRSTSALGAGSGSTSEHPRAIWVPGHDWEGAPPESPVAREPTEFAELARTQELEYERRFGLIAWRTRIRTKMAPSSLLIIVTPISEPVIDRSANTHATLLQVVEQWLGPASPGTVTLLQRADLTDPTSCVGLVPLPGQRYFIAGNLDLDGNLRIIVDYQDQTIGWAHEYEPGRFRIPDGPTHVSVLDLMTIGVL